MESNTANPSKTQNVNPEQLLKLLESQVAAARARRSAREASRSSAGKFGVIIIIGGAALALWMLSLLLEQMRPQQAEASSDMHTAAEVQDANFQTPAH